MTDMAAIACDPVMRDQLGGLLLGGNWLLMSVLALVVSTLALSLLYMFASFLRNPQLTSWTKFELFQVFGTAAVMVFFGGVLYGTCTFDMSFLDSRYVKVDPGHTTNMYTIIDNYFDKLEDLGYLIFYFILWITKWFAFLSRVTLLSSPLGIGSNENPLESLGQLNSLIFVMISGFVTSFLLLQFQMRMLDYLALAAIGYLFPMGIFFRCFEPTRSFGGTLLGIAVSLFLFYPIIMVFNDYLMYGQISAMKADQMAALSQAEANVGAGKTPSPQAVSEGIAGTYDPQNGATGYNGFTEGVTGGFLFIIKPVLLYAVAAVILPVINFIVLVEITRGTTAFLGDEIDVSNLTRLI
ncbi:MAG: hypothetical protein WC861_05375 [Candidatus Micrarchaeia archaeon]|jgi:hypothetical protein